MVCGHTTSNPMLHCNVHTRAHTPRLKWGPYQWWQLPVVFSSVKKILQMLDGQQVAPFSSYSVMLWVKFLPKKPQMQWLQAEEGPTWLNLSAPREIGQNHKSTSRLQIPVCLFTVCVFVNVYVFVYVSLYVWLSWGQLGYCTVLLQGSTWWSSSVWKISWEPELMKARVLMFASAPCPLYSRQSKWPSRFTLKSTFSSKYLWIWDFKVGTTCLAILYPVIHEPIKYSLWLLIEGMISVCQFVRAELIQSFETAVIRKWYQCSILLLKITIDIVANNADVIVANIVLEWC